MNEMLTVAVSHYDVSRTGDRAALAPPCQRAVGTGLLDDGEGSGRAGLDRRANGVLGIDIGADLDHLALVVHLERAGGVPVAVLRADAHVPVDLDTHEAEVIRLRRPIGALAHRSVEGVQGAAEDGQGEALVW